MYLLGGLIAYIYWCEKSSSRNITATAPLLEKVLDHPSEIQFFFPLYVTFLYFSGCLQQYIGANVQAENPKEVRLGALRRYLRKFFTEAARQGKRGHSTTKKGENKSN